MMLAHRHQHPPSLVHSVLLVAVGVLSGAALLTAFGGCSSTASSASLLVPAQPGRPGRPAVSTTDLEGVRIELPPWWSPASQAVFQLPGGSWQGLLATGTVEGDAQDGEDAYAFENFFYNVWGGTYLEIGGLDGVQFSNTRWFHRIAGWRGILVEGSPTEFAKLVTNRPHDVRVNAALCGERRTVHYIEHASVPAVNGIVEFMSDAFKKEWHPNIDLAKTKPLTCLPLSEVLSHLGVTHVDFFSLDVEGGELGVLQSLDFARVTFNVLVVEYAMKLEDVDAIRHLLEKAGYEYVGALVRNHWYTRRGWRGASKKTSGR